MNATYYTVQYICPSISPANEKNHALPIKARLLLALLPSYMAEEWMI